MGFLSCYFESDSGTVWNPSTTTARLFLGYAATVSAAVDVESGLGALVDDECQIDAEKLHAFCQAIRRLLAGSNSTVLAALLRGFLVVAAVLAERADSSRSVNAPTGTDEAAWRSEVAEMGKRMPTQ